ncbi:MAG: ABC-type glycerol-3-phosphate transport system substrate-binding protein [Verrucomicrobiales bacterium]|jgi:ABC-type glycerol-3-phosphate transport system substrate-binding protein
MRVLIALFALLAIVAASCGSDEAAVVTATTAAAAPADSGDSAGSGAFCGDGDVDLLIWGSRDYYLAADLWQGFLDDCPNITITTQVEPNDDILQQLQRMQDAGQRLPDVIQDDTFLIEAYQNAGLLADHTEQRGIWEEEDPDFYNLILPIAWEENSFGDGIYGLAITANFDIIYYNIAVCTEAGVDCAGITTLDGFLEAMQAVKDSGSDAIPLTVQALPGTGITTLKTFLAAADAPFDGAVPDLQSEGGLYTLNWFLDAAAAGLLPEQAVAWGEDEARGAFAGQRAAFILDGFTVAGEFNEIDGFNLGTGWGVVPSPTRGDGNQVSAARTWAVTSASENPYEAMLAIRHLSQAGILVDNAAGGSVPARNTDMLADPRLDDIWPFFDDNLRAAYLGSDATPAGLNGGEVELELEKLWGEIISGSATDAQALADKYQPILEGL